MASLTNSATIAADAIPARKLVGCIDEAIAATSNILLWGCEAADHACFGLTLLDVPKKCDLFLGRADNSGCREHSDGSSSFGRQQFTTEESARTADESEVSVSNIRRSQNDIFRQLRHRLLHKNWTR